MADFRAMAKMVFKWCKMPYVGFVAMGRSGEVSFPISCEPVAVSAEKSTAEPLREELGGAEPDTPRPPREDHQGEAEPLLDL